MATAPAKAAPAKKSAPTITLKHLAADLAQSHEMSKKQTEAVLGDLVGLVTKHLKKGDRIRIGGLGILVVRKRAARMGRNPATGEPIQIKASKKVAFRPAKELKEAGGRGGPAVAGQVFRTTSHHVDGPCGRRRALIHHIVDMRRQEPAPRASTDGLRALRTGLPAEAPQARSLSGQRRRLLANALPKADFSTFRNQPPSG